MTIFNCFKKIVSISYSICYLNIARYNFWIVRVCIIGNHPPDRFIADNSYGVTPI
ncbi:MAG: hypothetical protein JWM59_1560 [Verrucomicrobiales bacterium]|nr:hypothetical protein [Verrucomicrobiales bacterium]